MNPSVIIPPYAKLPISKWKAPIKNIMAILLAGFIYSISIKYFIFPSKIILTGFEGISLSISYFLEQPIIFILLYAVFQTILMIFAFFTISRRFSFLSTLLILTVISLLITLPDYTFANAENERLLLVLFGGIIAGIAKALALRHHGSVGDEDVLVAFYAQKWKKPVGSIGVGAGIISTVFGITLIYLGSRDIEVVINTLMYTSVFIFVATETVNILFKKYHISKLLITTQQIDKLELAIRQGLNHRSFTVQKVQGGISKKHFHTISIILAHEDLENVIQFITQSDPDAFIYYHDIEGVKGHIPINPIG